MGTLFMERPYSLHPPLVIVVTFAQCNLAIKLVLPARPWLLPAPICFTCRLVVSKTASTHITLAKVYQVRLLPCKTNLTSSPEFGDRAGEPGDKAS